MQFSQRMMRIKPSATRAMADKAAALKAAGKKIISLTTGEPDFPSPQVSREYAARAMQQNYTHYTATGGIPELKEAIRDYYLERHGLSFAANEIAVGTGAKAILYETLGALVDPGTEVIVITPAWVSYVEQIDAFDGKAVLVDSTATGYEPRLADIEKALTDKTVAIMLNTPHNPTGSVYSRSFMKDLCLLARDRRVMVLNDEIYERLTYGTRYHNPLVDAPEARDWVVSINGVSKAYAMTGWRIGFALGPAQLINKITTLQGHITSSACSIAQWASVGAIRHAQEDVAAMVAEYARRLDFVYGKLQAMPHITVQRPQGAFYIFLDLKNCIGKKHTGNVIASDTDFCEMLMEHGLVAMVPGSSFLAPGYARMSYATSMEELSQAMDNLQGFLQALE